MLVLFLGLMGGAAYGVQSYLGGDTSAGLAFQVDAPRSLVNTTAGSDVTVPFVIHNRGDVARTAALQVTGAGVDLKTAAVTVPARSNATVFATFAVPDNATGTQGLTVTVLDADGRAVREKTGVASVRVLPGIPGFQEGDSALVRYTGRLAATGKVFDSNDPALAGLAFPATADFRPGNTQPLQVDSLPRPTVITGFYEALLGMQPGETKSVTFPPEKGYGNATESRDMDRIEELERDYVLELTTETVGRTVFDDYVEESGQGDAASFEVGDAFVFEQGPNRWPYRIVRMTPEVVDYQLDAEVGQAFTLYPFWEGASQVVSVNETHTHFRTTPTTDVGEAFTMRGYWPEMSKITNITDTTIVVEHTPPIGYKFTIPQTQTTPAQEATVQSLTESDIVVAVASGHPLAGQSLTFDIELLEIRR